jgi:transcriptional regulator of acetoin/glycerol metabolism
VKIFLLIHYLLLSIHTVKRTLTILPAGVDNTSVENLVMSTAFRKDTSCIKRSHERCRRFGVEVDRVDSRRISENDELFRKLEQKRELILLTEPFMNQLYDFVKGSNFFSILTDEEGCILSMIGDEEILSKAFSLRMVPGAYMDEASIGTNAMGTALAERRPVQMCAQHGQYLTGESPVITLERREDIDEGKGVRRKR